MDPSQIKATSPEVEPADADDQAPEPTCPDQDLEVQ